MYPQAYSLPTFMSNQPWQTFGGFWFIGFWFGGFWFVGFWFCGFRIGGFSVCLSQITVLGLVVAGSMVFLCGVRFPVASSAAAGFEALGSATSNSEALWFKQHQVHHTNAAEPTSFTATPEHNSAKPNVGEAVSLYSAISGRHNHQPILIIN